jgi:hypothetical protein
MLSMGVQAVVLRNTIGAAVACSKRCSLMAAHSSRVCFWFFFLLVDVLGDASHRQRADARMIRLYAATNGIPEFR